MWFELGRGSVGTIRLAREAATHWSLDPPNRLVYTWQWESDPAETQVTLEFLSRGTATELVLTHEGFADGDSRAHHEQGWTSILERLGGQLPAAL